MWRLIDRGRGKSGFLMRAQGNVVISKCPCRGVGAKVHVEISSAIQPLQCSHVDVILRLKVNSSPLQPKGQRTASYRTSHRT